MSAPRTEILAALRDMLPLIVGAVPFGILFGALATTAGLSTPAIMGLSLLVFAGSAQFIAATLVLQGAGVAIIILTTFVVNLRHGLYSASLGPYLNRLPQRWVAPLAFWLTDETYAVVVQRYQQQTDNSNTHWYYLGSALFMYINWQVCTVIGIFTGQAFAGLKDWGLEFAMVVTFIGIVVPLIRSMPMLLCAIVSAVTATLWHGMPNQLGLILASLCGITSGILLQLILARRSGLEPDDTRGKSR